MIFSTWNTCPTTLELLVFENKLKINLIKRFIDKQKKYHTFTVSDWKLFAWPSLHGLEQTDSGILVSSFKAILFGQCTNLVKLRKLKRESQVPMI